MIRTFASLTTLAAIAATSMLPAVAAPAKAKEEKVYCPYMDFSVKKSKAHKTTYKGKTYYFCCEECEVTFKKNPKKQKKVLAVLLVLAQTAGDVCFARLCASRS